jgi:hypothetical protein
LENILDRRPDLLDQDFHKALIRFGIGAAGILCTQGEEANEQHGSIQNIDGQILREIHGSTLDNKSQ